MDLRKERGKTQNIYLIETSTSPIENERKYVVMGTTNNKYTVTINNDPSCTCPDYTQRQRRCKHIYFILIKIMKVSEEREDQEMYNDLELYNMFKNIPEITNNLNSSCKPMREPFGECPICLDGLDYGTLDYCKYSCGQPIHVECFYKWSYGKKIATCVYCRHDWMK